MDLLKLMKIFAMDSRQTVAARIDDLKSVVQGLNAQLHLGKPMLGKQLKSKKPTCTIGL
ncbi:MAG: hypothetical protein ACJAYA_001410 [Bacteroidia bacterium]